MPVQRKRPSDQPLHYDGNKAVIVFVTVCTKVRENRLAFPQAEAALLEAWREADLFKIGQYVIMPDHVHLFCTPARYPSISVRKWTEYWKSLAANKWPLPVDGKLWLRGFWDTQIRSSAHYHEKWDYILRNPVRANLVDRPEEWKFRGILHNLEWHD